MAERIFSLVVRVGVKAGFAVTGGMAKNRGVMDRLLPMIGLERMQTEWDTQLAGAAGAALFGYALCRKGKGRKKLQKISPAPAPCAPDGGVENPRF
jgi:benzoyl-CoA reductase subunit A